MHCGAVDELVFSTRKPAATDRAAVVNPLPVVLHLLPVAMTIFPNTVGIVEPNATPVPPLTLASVEVPLPLMETLEVPAPSGKVAPDGSEPLLLAM